MGKPAYEARTTRSQTLPARTEAKKVVDEAKAFDEPLAEAEAQGWGEEFLDMAEGLHLMPD